MSKWMVPLLVTLAFITSPFNTRLHSDKGNGNRMYQKKFGFKTQDKPKEVNH
uniref:Uncharacterized protein n=1 Tax=Rhizophora mucronata TaxID=61149 RepID=A0A2P2P3Q9_RHIMU